MTVYKKETDNRMLWIRDMERTKTKLKNKHYVAEHEIVSECMISGYLNYDDGQIRCWSLLYKNAYIHTLHTYLLPIVLGEGVDDERTPDGKLILTGSRKGYVSSSNISELIGLLSLAMHARFFHVHTTTLNVGEVSIATRYGNPFTYHPCANERQKQSPLFSGEGKSLTLMSDVLNAVKKLPMEKHLQFYRAISNYADGIRRIGDDDELAYLRLVSAIEAVSNVKNGENTNQFTDFIIKHSDGYFEGKRKEPEHICVTRKNLKKVASAIYEARSNFLHDGEAMWISWETANDKSNGRGWDYDGSLGMHKDQHRWVNKEHLPTVLFFEELVRHCLLNYLDPSLIKKLPL